MENFDTARAVLETSLNSSGSAMTEHAKWSDSLEARLNKLKATWQSLSQTFMNSDFLKGGVSTLTGFVNILDKLIDSLGTLGTIGLGTSLFNIVKHLKDFKNFKIFSALPIELKSLGLGFKALGYDIKSFIKTPAGIASAIGLVTATIGLAYNAIKNYKEEISKARQETIQASDDFLDASSTFEKAYIKYSGKTSLTSEEESELQSAIQGTVDALGDKSSALQSAVNSSNDYISSLEAIAKAELKAANAAAKNKKDNAELELKDLTKGWSSLDGSEVNIEIPTTEKESIELAKQLDFYTDRVQKGSRHDVPGLYLSADADVNEIIEYYNTLLEYRDMLSEQDMIDTKAYSKVNTVIGQMSESIAVYEDGVYDAAKAQYQLTNGIPKTVEEYLKMRESILSDMNASGSSFDTRKNIANTLDTEYGQMFDLTTNEIQSKKLIGVLNEFDNEEALQIEAFLNMRTAINNGECSVGDYISQFEDISKMTEGWSEEAKEELKLSFGLDTDTIKKQYDGLLKEMPDNIGDKAAEDFLGSLSKSELSAVYSLKADINWQGSSPEEILAQVKEQAALNEAMSYTINITVETEGIEALNTALSEARSATGLTAESITALKSRYEDLDSFDAAALFENTAVGVRLNNEELAKLEAQYETVNKLDIDKNLSTLVTKYKELTEQIKSCTDAEKKEELQNKVDTYEDKIIELQTLASQYDGLTSAYNKWVNAQSSPNDGDNYDSIYDNLKAIKELRDKGLVGTDDFKTAAQLMTNEDLSNASIDKIVSAFDKGYPKMQRYFTDSKKGCQTFLSDISKINSEWAHLNEDGKWEINFDAKEVADELGTSVDLIYLIAQKLKDYGFEIELDDTSLDNLQTDIEKAETKLKELGEEPYPVNLDVKAENIETEIDKIKTYINEVNNSSAEPDVKTAKLEDARVKLEALIQKKQEASKPAFMNLDASQVNASLVDALEKVKSYQTALNEVNKLNELKEAGIAVDDSELDAAKQKADECVKAIQGLDGSVKVAIGLDEDGSLDSIKKAFEDGKVKIDANTDPAVTKIEQLAKNVEKIEDKDVTINVTVNGLDDVKELNKQISLATDIDGNIDKLSEYVENAKALSELDNSTVSYISANIDGNAINLFEGQINNLEVFAEGAKALKGVGSFTSNITANIEGNVKDIPEYQINNLKVFSDSADGLNGIGSVESNVKANIEGNVKDTPEYMINNLKVYSDNAENIASIGNVESTVNANIEGNVKDLFEGQIDNLKVYSDNAENIASIGNVSSKVEANIEGNVTGMLEKSIDNLKVYSDSAEKVASIGNVYSSVNANIDGNVAGMLESSIDNLKAYSNNAKEVANIGNVSSSVEANIDGNVATMLESSIDNLKAYSESAKNVAEIGDVESSVKANVDGNVTGMLEASIDNIKVFAESAEALKGIGDITSNVTANVRGNVVNSFEEQIDNLEIFADRVKELQDADSVDVTITANIEGNLNDGKNIKDLALFAESVKNLQGIGSSTVTITANIEGNVLDTAEIKINNLETFAKGAEALKGVGSIESNVTANIDGNVVDEFEYKIDNIKLFAESAKALDGVGSIESNVTANVRGNVVNSFEEQIDNLEIFADSAEALKDVGTFESNVTANINGNVKDTPEYQINNLKVFADSAKALDNVESSETSIDAEIKGNVHTWSGNFNDLRQFAAVAKDLQGTKSSDVKVTANIEGTVNESNVSTLERFAAVVGSLPTGAVNLSVKASVDTANIGSAISLLEQVASSGLFKDYNANVQVTYNKVSDAVDSYNPLDLTRKVTYELDASDVYAFNPPNLHRTVTYTVVYAGGGAAEGGHMLSNGTWYDGGGGRQPVDFADGTAHANGTAQSGRAFKHGDWRTKDSGIALMGELGRELIVRDGRFFTVGDDGAGFFPYKKGDVIFNHKQTEELFKNGFVTSNGGRGILHGGSFANGTADTDGAAFITGSGQFWNGLYGSKSSSSSSVKTSTKYKSDSNSDSSEENKNEVFDWIEKLLERFDRTIDLLDNAANNIYRSFDKRNTSLSDEISKVTEQIANQKKAYDRYMAEADYVGKDGSYNLTEEWRKKVRDGDFDVSVLNDEKLIEYIGYYQDWYEKALDAQEAIEELKETLSSLYALRVENVATKYEGILGVIEHEKNILEEYINQSETQAWLVSSEYYDALASNERETIAELQNQKAEMLIAFEEAMDSGTIEEHSESWYEMVNSIDEVTLAIKESETQLLEYEQTLQQLDWEVFDLLQEKISSVNEETEFLIELLSSNKLYDDNGQLTDDGKSTMGLHGVAYNTYMHQADLAAEEVAKLKKELESDPYDTELEARYREMVALQQEYILSAQSEKEAIRDLVEEGIQFELDALDERIEKYNEALDSQKDLYDYQKKVKEQTKEIASIEKQMAAYAGDDSEEAKAKIQELRVSLEEAEADLEDTEYDRYISDTQQMLDNLKLEYEETLNGRLDNIDYLVEQMIAEINSDASVIGDTIREAADKVGYTLTDSMKTIWDGDAANTKNVITTYGDKFLSAQTTTNTALNSINANLQNMINQLNTKATANTKSASTSSVAKSSSTKTTTTKTTTKKTSGGDGTPKIGDKVKFVSGQYYYDSQGKKPLGSHKQGEYVYITNINKKDWATHPYHVSTGTKLGSGDLGWLKLNQISGYATGKKNFSNDEVAWTQEDGKEFIVRPSDGAILTPIAKRDSILTSAASNNIWKMANSPAEFIKDNLNLGTTNVPNNSNIQSNYTQHLDKVVFNLPNVQNYEQLLSSMQKDKNFEKLILSMTIDRIAGKSSLAKGKSLR